MRRRNSVVLLVWALVATLLWVQSPWAHAQRMGAVSAARQAADHAVTQGVQGGDEAPCHGAAHDAPAADPSPAPASPDTCCADGHCDGHCAQVAWALTAPDWHIAGIVTQPLQRLQTTGLQRMRQPELFRPPI